MQRLEMENSGKMKMPLAVYNASGATGISEIEKTKTTRWSIDSTTRAQSPCYLKIVKKKSEHEFFLGQYYFIRNPTRESCEIQSINQARWKLDM